MQTENLCHNYRNREKKKKEIREMEKKKRKKKAIFEEHIKYLTAA